MGTRGMIMQERTEEALAAAMRLEFGRLPRGTWMTAEQLAEASPDLERCGDGRYEVVMLGATVSADEVQAAAREAMHDASDVGVRVAYDGRRGFAVYDLAG